MLTAGNNQDQVAPDQSNRQDNDKQHCKPQQQQQQQHYRNQTPMTTVTIIADNNN